MSAHVYPSAWQPHPPPEDAPVSATPEWWKSFSLSLSYLFLQKDDSQLKTGSPIRCPFAVLPCLSCSSPIRLRAARKKYHHPKGRRPCYRVKTQGAGLAESPCPPDLAWPAYAFALFFLVPRDVGNSCPKRGRKKNEKQSNWLLCFNDSARCSQLFLIRIV